MDTSWCPVCDRLIPPNRQQIFPEASTSSPPQSPADLPSPKPSKSKLAPNGQSNQRTNKSTKRNNKSALTSPPPADAQPIPTPKIKAPKPRTVLTQEPSLYCSEECRQRDLQSTLDLSSYTASTPPSSYSSFSRFGTSRSPPTSPSFASESDTDDPEHHVGDYFQPIHESLPRFSGRSTTPSIRPPRHTASSSDSIASAWADPWSKHRSPTKPTFNIPSMTPLSRTSTRNSSVSRPPSIHSPHHTPRNGFASTAPFMTGTSAPQHRNAADLYITAYPLAFERSQSSGAIALHRRNEREYPYQGTRGRKQSSSGSRERESCLVEVDEPGLSPSDTFTTPRTSIRRATSKRSSGSSSSSSSKSKRISIPRYTDPESSTNLLVHVTLSPPSSSSPRPASHIYSKSKATVSLTTPVDASTIRVKDILPPRSEAASAMLGLWNAEDAARRLSTGGIPTYPLEIAPLKPGEKRKRLFRFGS